MDLVGVEVVLGEALALEVVSEVEWVVDLGAAALPEAGKIIFKNFIYGKEI